MKSKGIKSAGKLKDIYNRLAAEPPTLWSVEDRCTAISVLKKSLTASQKPGAIFIIGGKKNLITLLKATSLSDTWKRHCLNGATTLARQLAEREDPDTFLETWKHLNKSDRLKFYSDLVALQARSLSLPNLPFTPTRVEIDKDCPNLGSFTWSSRRKMDLAKTKIIMRGVNRNNATPDNLGTIWHEQLHAIMHQLAIGYHAGTIKKDHPFYEDAKLMYYRVLHTAHGTIELGEDVYDSDTEEALCGKTERRLIRDYKK